jgi:hypothetical protein
LVIRMEEVGVGVPRGPRIEAEAERVILGEA